MAKTWVLHTETKGTGAQVVPLESVTKRSSTVEPVLVPRQPRAKPKPPEPQPRPPRKFKIVDLMTRRALVEDAGTRETVEALRGVRSIVDVNVYVWQEEHQRWWLMTFGQKRTLWDLSRERAAESAA
jgi:hypothetical protein